MALLGELAVNLVANTKGLTKGFKKAGSLTQSFTKRLKVGLAAAATAAAAGMAVFVKQQLALIDALAKSSELLGISIADLQKYHLAAKLGGVSTQTFNTALQRLVRRSAEAQQGSKNLIAVFQNLGLSVDELAQLDPAQLFEKVGEGLNKIGDSGERVRLAMGVFDTEGVKLINVYGEGLRLAAEQQEKFGAVTDDQAESVEMLGEKWAILWDSLKRTGQQIMLEWIDPMIAGLEKINAGLEKLAEFQKSLEEGLTHMFGGKQDFMGAATDAERLRGNAPTAGFAEDRALEAENNALSKEANSMHARVIEQNDREWEALFAGDVF